MRSKTWQVICLAGFTLLLLIPGPARAGEGEKGSFSNPEKVKPKRPAKLDARPVCDREAKVAPLDPEGVYRCQGLPFGVALPPGETFEQLWGKGWLSLQKGTKDSLVVVSYQPALWAMRDNRMEGAGSYARNFLTAIGAANLSLGESTPYDQDHAEDARRITFEFGPPERHFMGESRSFFVRGWFVNMMVGGLEGSLLKRDGPGAKALFRSLDVVKKPTSLIHAFDSGATLTLPVESWLMAVEKKPGHVAAARYYVPGNGAYLSFSEGQAPKACASLSETDWLKITGDVAPRDAKGTVHFQSSRWLRVGKRRIFVARARTEISEGKLVPAVAGLLCQKGRLFQIFALDSFSRAPDLQDEVIRMLGTLRLTGDR